MSRGGSFRPLDGCCSSDNNCVARRAAQLATYSGDSLVELCDMAMVASSEDPDPVLLNDKGMCYRLVPYSILGCLVWCLWYSQYHKTLWWEVLHLFLDHHFIVCHNGLAEG